MKTEEVVDARKTRIDEEQAWAMLKTAKAVTVAKGKKVQKLNPAEDSKEEVLQQVMGPSGNLRAPTYRVSDEYIIGFNADLYEAWVK